MPEIETKPLIPIESWDKWDNAARSIEDEELVGKTCFGGVSESLGGGKLNALALVFPWGVKDGRLVYRLLVSVWENGHAVDDFVRRVAEAGLVYDIRGVCYDEWNMARFANEVADYGVQTFKFVPSFASYDRPCKVFAECVERGTIYHTGNIVLQEQVRRCQVAVHADGRLMLSNKGNDADVTVVRAVVMAIAAQEAYLADLVAQREKERAYRRAVDLVGSRSGRRGS